MQMKYDKNIIIAQRWVRIYSDSSLSSMMFLKRPVLGQNSFSNRTA